MYILLQIEKLYTLNFFFNLIYLNSKIIKYLNKCFLNKLKFFIIYIIKHISLL